MPFCAPTHTAATPSIVPKIPKVIAMMESLLQPGWLLKILAIPVALEALTLTTMASPKASATRVAHVSSATRSLWIVGEV